MPAFEEIALRSQELADWVRQLEIGRVIVQGHEWKPLNGDHKGWQCDSHCIKYDELTENWWYDRGFGVVSGPDLCTVMKEVANLRKGERGRRWLETGEKAEFTRLQLPVEIRPIFPPSRS